VWIADRNNHRFRVLQPVAAQRVEVRGGNHQTGVAGSSLPVPLSVRLILSTGTPLPGATVTFAVQSGTATVNTAQATTDFDGGAFTTVTLGARGGPIIITASFGNAEPARFTLTATEAAIPIVTERPRIAPGGVVGVGNSVPAVRALSANALVSIYGENFAVAGTGRRVRAEEFVNGRLPTNFLGVCVSIDGVRAPVIDVFPAQLNVQVPALSSTTTANVTVTVNCGTASALTSEGESVPVRLASPELLYLVNNTDGVNPVAAVNAVTGSLIGPPDIIAAAAPASPGDAVTIYGTGFGPVLPPVAPGAFPGAVARVDGTVTVRLNGQEAEVLYAGVAPGTVIYQVNFRIPANAPSGRLSVVVSISGLPSPPGAYLTVR
jgi:uncharacterized protein (TIGR03437 family)